MTLYDIIRSRILDETGFACRQAGLPLSWTVGLLMAAAIVVAIPGGANADGSGPHLHGATGCAGMPPPYGDWYCANIVCPDYEHFDGDCALGMNRCACWGFST